MNMLPTPLFQAIPLEHTRGHAIEGYAATLNGSRPLLLVNVSEPIRRVFELTGAAGNLNIELGNREAP